MTDWLNLLTQMNCNLKIFSEKGEKAYRSVDLRYDDQIICK